MDTSQINDAYDIVTGKLETWITGLIEMLPNLVVALLVLIVFYVIGKFARRGVSNLLGRVSVNKTISNLLETIISIAWYWGFYSSEHSSA